MRTTLWRHVVGAIRVANSIFTIAVRNIIIVRRDIIIVGVVFVIIAISSSVQILSGDECMCERKKDNAQKREDFFHTPPLSIFSTYMAKAFF